MRYLFLPPPLSIQKVTFILLLFFSAIFASAQDKYLPKYLTEKDDPLVKDAKTLTQNGWIELKAETSVAPDQFFERYAGSLGLKANPHLKFEKFSSETSQKGEEHQRYQLYYDDIKVEGLEFLLHAREGKVRSASGKIVSALEIDTESRLSEAEALWANLTNRMRIGLSPTTGRSLATLDIVAHELMHGYTRHMAGGTGLNGTAESDLLHLLTLF